MPGNQSVQSSFKYIKVTLKLDIELSSLGGWTDILHIDIRVLVFLYFYEKENLHFRGWNVDEWFLKVLKARCNIEHRKHFKMKFSLFFFTRNWRKQTVTMKLALLWTITCINIGSLREHASINKFTSWKLDQYSFNMKYCG